MRREAPVVLSMVLLAAVAGAQEDVREQDLAVEGQEMQEMSAEDRRPLVVLENPYELSSFYRSPEGSYMGPGYPMYPGSGYYGSSGTAPAGADRYPIASYYRQRDGWYGYGYAPFWTGGYGAYGYGGYGGHGARGGRGHRGRGGLGLGFRRSIGENGDLFLFAPAFLAPVGPLTGVFFGGGSGK